MPRGRVSNRRAILVAARFVRDRDHPRDADLAFELGAAPGRLERCVIGLERDDQCVYVPARSTTQMFLLADVMTGQRPD